MNLNGILNVWNDVQSYYRAHPDIWTTIIWTILKIAFILVVGKVVGKLASKSIEHMMVERQKSPLKFDPRRTMTIGKLVRNISNYTINFVMILLVLNQFGINLAPLLAGAGVVGLAVGFGAQSLVKDVITGFFIIFEDQFGVGDVIQTDTYKGTVEEIGLRVTRIRTWTGEVHIIPNGLIQHVTNFSLHNSIGVMDISIAYEEDPEKAMAIMRETAMRMYESHPDIVKEPDILGVTTLGPSQVTIRITVECRPNTQHAVTRLMNLEIKRAFEENGVELPYPKVVNLIQQQRRNSDGA